MSKLYKTNWIIGDPKLTGRNSFQIFCLIGVEIKCVRVLLRLRFFDVGNNNVESRMYALTKNKTRKSFMLLKI